MNSGSSGVVKKKRFGGGRPPTGTPSLAWSSVVVVVSLLSGASLVHRFYNPDLTIPPAESAAGSGGITKEEEEAVGKP